MWMFTDNYTLINSEQIRYLRVKKRQFTKTKYIYIIEVFFDEIDERSDASRFELIGEFELVEEACKKLIEWEKFLNNKGEAPAYGVKNILCLDGVSRPENEVQSALKDAVEGEL